jgi:hypothetical protein
MHLNSRIPTWRKAPPITRTVGRSHRDSVKKHATTAHDDAYTFAEFQTIFARAGFLRSEFPRPSAGDVTGGGVV